MIRQMKTVKMNPEFMGMIIEACVESLEEALLVEKLGADRIELCADLAHQGLTPSRDLIYEVCKKLSIPVKVMIRPHYRSFHYSEPELQIMEEDIRYCRDAGAWGVVYGVQGDNGWLDREKILRLSKVAAQLNRTVHKVIDQTPDPLISLKELKDDGGVDSVLTSGGARTAIEGIPVLREMLRLSEPGIELIVAGSVLSDMPGELQKRIGATSFHGRRIVRVPW